MILFRYSLPEKEVDRKTKDSGRHSRYSKIYDSEIKALNTFLNKDFKPPLLTNSHKIKVDINEIYGKTEAHSRKIEILKKEANENFRMEET